MPPRSPKLPREQFAVTVGGKRRPRVDKARELFATATKSLVDIKRKLVEEFGISMDVADMDVADMIREMAAEQFELRPHYRSMAIANCEAVFHAAMRDGKISAAVRALELHAKITGILQQESAQPERPRLDLSVLSSEERAQFREQLDRVSQAQLAAGRPGAQA